MDWEPHQQPLRSAEAEPRNRDAHGLQQRRSTEGLKEEAAQVDCRRPSAVEASDPGAESEGERKGSRLLTLRERDVMVCLATGLTMGEIGHQLNISSHTVGEHLKNVRRKLGTANSVHSLAKCLKSGELDQDDLCDVDSADMIEMRR